MKKEVYLILDNIRSAENVGSIFRTSDAAGINKIFLIGITPSPIDRFGRPRKDIAKVSLGAEKTIPWEYFQSIEKIIKKLKKNKFEIIALEQNDKAINYRKIKIKAKTALIVGNEVYGVSKKALRMSDKIAEIPMKGKKESLNVSVAAGIMLFQMTN